ncbi:PucR family transcriptional regulator [Amycolatopsis palatopharyngis]|uniref:PucR family transcriptional regulator n=1 Tax=Amycolatopsis palatopharyngis TaxID=187982 RepID=UPI0013BE9950|nr:PucR family transcriptional regulator [Amycolatopsis palatopharyngis]
MSFTLRDLVDLDELDLTVLAGEHELHQPITWVHVSEAADPTPFLEGGELLLTTGLLLDEAELNGQSYLRRLADVGAVGLGFGTGLRYEHVPESLVMTARKVGLALVKVPLHTPFMAISKAVSRAIAAEEYAAVKRAYDAQQALTRAAIGAEGTGALIAQLARRLGAWAVLLDPGGTIVHAAPSSASGRVEGFDAELDRLRGRRAPASAAFRHGEHDVVVQSLGNEPRIRGFLAVGRADPLSPQDRHVVNTAVSLLTLGLEQSRRLENAERQLRTAVLRLLLVAQVATAQLLAQELGGGLPEEPIRVTAVAGPARLRAAAAEMLSAEAAGKDEPVFHSDTEDVLVIVSTDGHPLGRWLQQLPGRLDGLTAGVSEPTTFDRFADGHRQAQRAVETGVRRGTPVTRFGDLGREGLRRFIDPARAEIHAEALLGPLLRHDATGRGDLVTSLRVWLEHHGQWDPAASRLRIHRHTLRLRMHKVEELLERSLDSPGTRAELWFALQTHIDD